LLTRGGVDQPQDVRLRQALDVAGHGVPDDEVPTPVIRVEEDAAVAAVKGAAVVGVGERGAVVVGARPCSGSPCMTSSA
jgi:hypothetical protein